jgi:hypothetical protein
VKSKLRTQQTLERVNQLKTENELLEEKIKMLTKELGFLKDLFLAHAGMVLRRMSVSRRSTFVWKISYIRNLTTVPMLNDRSMFLRFQSALYKPARFRSQCPPSGRQICRSAEDERRQIIDQYKAPREGIRVVLNLKETRTSISARSGGSSKRISGKDVRFKFIKEISL